jgi:hypothetical protein
MAARAFLARHHSARVARLGELLEPLDYPALLAEADGGRLLAYGIPVRDEIELEKRP